MAAPTNTLATYSAVGNREDLADMIYALDQADTPFFSKLERTVATSTKHS